MKGKRSLATFGNQALYSGLLARVFLAIFVSAVVGLGIAPLNAQAAECPSSFSAGGYFFNATENVEYSSEGYPIQHLKVNFADGRAFRLTWSYYDDECNSASVTGNQRTISLPAGVRDWSVRVVSPTRIEVWNDQNNTAITGFDVPTYPSYTSIAFGGTIDGGASTFGTRKLKINQSGEPPVFTGTLPKPEACASVADGAIGGTNPYFFSAYEHAEYVDGLLRVHLRLKTPYNDGRPFRSGISTGDENCIMTGGPLGPVGTAVTPRVRYFSFRMVSETDWQLWDDESNQPLTCVTCSGSLSVGTKYVQWFGSVDNGASTIRTTPFAPVEAPEYAECCSSVVFIPGIKGSVLKKGTNVIWPPTILSTDIPDLALDPITGESVNAITVDGVLESFYGTPIYSGFTTYLNSLVSHGTIGEWKSLPYDWRFSPEKILNDGVSTPDGVIDVIEKIEQTAANSETGQVTIIAHSMGGLMGKAIIKALEEQGKAGLVDSFVMVGTPQLGTPQAIAALLHGDDESILGGLIVNPALVRQVGQSIPGSYNLLPSRRYFDVVIDPPVVFDEAAPFTEVFRTAWETTINSYSELSAFLTGSTVTRLDPPLNELRTPEILNPSILADVSNFHDEYDTYQFPDSIRVIQVAGWGVPTAKAVRYKNNHFLPSYKIIPTIEGDRTVVYPSATASTADETYFFDLFSFNRDFRKTIQHRDLLSADGVQNLVLKVVQEEIFTPTTYLSANKPLVVQAGDQIIISSHSPVVLGVYDSFGNFTGINQEQDLSSEVLSVSENIPGSVFVGSAESQYIFLPKQGVYRFVYKGVGEGPTTIEIESFSNETVSPNSVYSDIPTITGLSANFTVDATSLEGTVIELDSNSDGQTDTYTAPDNGVLTLTQLLTNLRTYVNGLEIKEKLKNNLLKRLDKLEKKIEKQKSKQANRVVSNLSKQISKKADKGKISEMDAQIVLNLLEQIENTL